MTVSMEAKMNTILSDVLIVKSDIQSGKLVDLTTLESRIKDFYHAVSDVTQQPPVADPGELQRHLTVLINDLDYLEKLLKSKKEGLDPPTSSI